LKLTSAIQESLIALLCYDDSTRGAKFVRALVPLSLYDIYYREIAEAAVEYIEKYKSPPGEHTLDIISILKTRMPDKADIFDQILYSLEQTKDGVNREYVINEAKAFIKYQKLKQGMTVALEHLQKNDRDGLVDAEKALNESLTGVIDLFNPGLLLNDTAKSLSFLNTDYSAFTTGIKELDARGLGPARKRLNVFMAIPGRGKSWWLVNLAKWALLHRLRVVYVTLELSEEEVSQRCMQALFSVSKRDEIHEHQVFESDELGRFVSMEPEAIAGRPHLQDPGIRKFLCNRVEGLGGKPPVIIREFPTGSLTVAELDVYLDSLEAALGFIPDLLLVDYADLMRIDSKYFRFDLGKIYKDLRGIAMKRNIGVATVSQSNREGGRVRVITEQHVGDDFSKIATADVVISYNQTIDEHDLGLARLFVVKGRTDRDKFTVLISQAYGLGQFCLESTRMVSSYWDYFRTDKDKEKHG